MRFWNAIKSIDWRHPTISKPLLVKVEKRLSPKKYRPINLAPWALARGAIRPQMTAVESDHGSGVYTQWDKAFAEWSAQSIRERSSILNLIRVPSRCRSWLTPRTSNVNTIRVVLACVGGEMPHLEEDKSYIATYSKTNPDAGLVRQIDPVTNQVTVSE